MAKSSKNHHTYTPPIYSLFDLHNHNVPQKIIFFMRIYGFENKNIVWSEKLEKSQFSCFDISHIGVLCTKT